MTYEQNGSHQIGYVQVASAPRRDALVRYYVTNRQRFCCILHTELDCAPEFVFTNSGANSINRPVRDLRCGGGGGGARRRHCRRISRRSLRLLKRCFNGFIAGRRPAPSDALYVFLLNARRDCAIFTACELLLADAAPAAACAVLSRAVLELHSGDSCEVQQLMRSHGSHVAPGSECRWPTARGGRKAVGARDVTNPIATSAACPRY
ncbi:hypothetical protein EVAR_55389_1 [Eumeta japonica]|uniref:Uncharacterized protein n=1 Tax=Eumeta variegata TaxID=151549 RepID=A0A4C1YTV2_EUMVA|nr:hypothetical protein EVAR_55389_1 [Eumeta japonica]